MNSYCHLDLPSLSFGAPVRPNSAVTILLHGRTQSPSDMLAIAERINLPDMAYVALQAHEKSWYPGKFMDPEELNAKALGQAIQRLDQEVERLVELGVERCNIAFLGFSQGACLACEYLYRRPARWGGLIAYTGGLIGPVGIDWSTSERLHGTPVVLANSDEDEWVPLTRTLQTALVFATMQADLTLRAFPGMAHVVNDEEVLLGRGLLARLMDSASTP
ncbi:hypothetical protein NPS49_09475 [Pseudomonas putida]|uniref:alpha/beta hydrolase n=1 Tax=Pseudomonas putida TaxID=303 RepID=UPI0023635544|nr:hypothetical protein [Pseudomonas putida]MDD2068549.1 hypothetical protein [Pseudomonas putida]HDS1738481.1 hypothetical protein [Pseudomonas putida]